MAKEVTLQVWMGAELKEKAETLYQGIGTSFAGAVCIFVKQSIQENGVPFVIATNKKSACSRLPKYTGMKLVAKGEGVYERAMVGKHEKTD